MNRRGTHGLATGRSTQPHARALAAVLFLAALLAPSCREMQRPADKADPAPYAGKSLRDATPADYDSIVDKVLALENAVREHPADPERVAALVEASFDTAAGSVLVVGKGVPNPTSPEATWSASRKTAARSDALRWALYLKAWRGGERKPFGARINGEIMYSRVLYEREGDDTLCQLVQVPIGSIVVK